MFTLVYDSSWSWPLFIIYYLQTFNFLLSLGGAKVLFFIWMSVCKHIYLLSINCFMPLDDATDINVGTFYNPTNIISKRTYILNF